jgi:hypothetical protein
MQEKDPHVVVKTNLEQIPAHSNRHPDQPPRKLSFISLAQFGERVERTVTNMTRLTVKLVPAQAPSTSPVYLNCAVIRTRLIFAIGHRHSPARILTSALKITSTTLRLDLCVRCRPNVPNRVMRPELVRSLLPRYNSCQSRVHGPKRLR